MFVSPTYGAASFTCPHCEAVTGQSWSGILRLGGDGTRTSRCQSSDCRRYTVWVGKHRRGTQGYEFLEEARIIWPPVRIGPEPNPDLGDDIVKDYNEARAVLDRSPRAAAALLRLALQKLMRQLGQTGENVNDDIAALVADGLRPDIQKALDIVRVTGNDAVHPGQIDTDDPEIVLKLFDLINIIAEDRLTQPARISALYDELPESKRAAISDRDG